MPAVPGGKYIDHRDQQQSRAYSALEDAYNAELTQRRQAYDHRWNYYYGKHKRPLLPDGSAVDDNVIVNLCELLIDKSVSSLMGTTEQGMILGPDFEICEPEPPPDATPMMRQPMKPGQPMMDMEAEQENPADEWLEEVWEANNKALILHDISVNGGVTGMCYLKLVPASIESEETGDLLPRIVVLDPRLVTPFWDEEDTDRVLWYRIEWGKQRTNSGERGRRRQDIIRADAIDPEQSGYWVIRNMSEAQGVNGWTVAEDETWDYPFAPVVEWKNQPKPNDHYGLDDMRTNPAVNDSYNFVLSNVQRIIKFHADPKTIGTGIGNNTDADGNTTADIIASEIGSFYTTPNENAKIYNLEMTSDLASSLNLATTLRRAFFDGGREVDSSTIQDKLGQVTNFGLRVLFRDALEKVGTKRLLYGQGLRDVCRYLLQLGGFGVQKVKVAWPDPLPKDETQQATALAQDRQNGLSQTTYLEKRGYDPETEAEHRQEEQAEPVFAQTVAQQGMRLDRFRNASNGMNGNGMDQGTTNDQQTNQQ